MSQSDVKVLEKKINDSIRKAQSNMFGGKNEEAWNNVEDIQKDVETIKSIDPSCQSLLLLEQKINRLRQDLEKKLGRSTSTIPRTEVRPKNPSSSISTQSKSLPTTIHEVPGEEKLPAGVTKRVQDIAKLLTQVKQLIEQDRGNKESLVERASYHLQSAHGIFIEIERMYAAQLGHSNVKAVQEDIGILSKELKTLSGNIEAEKNQASTAMKQSIDENQQWIDKMMPYLAGGVDEKQLELSIIQGKERLLRQRDLLTEVKNIYDEYRVNEPVNGKTSELDQTEKDLMRRMNEGKIAYDQSIKTIIEDAVSIIDEKLNWFKSDTEWRRDESIQPKWLTKRDRETIAEKIGKVKELVPELLSQDSVQHYGLDEKFQRLEKEDLERLDLLPNRTFMVPEKYVGGDADNLKAKAEELMKEKEPSAKILKVHLIREAWRVEDVVEYTDTSRTTIHHRITYHLSAQVAAEIDGKVKLYNAHIAKNQRSDGSFDKHVGNLEDYPQTIARENLPKLNNIE